MTRVSLDVSAVPRQPVGAGRYTIDLVSALAARDDIELVLWARRGDAGRWTGLGRSPTVRADVPIPRPVRLLWEQALLPRMLRAAGVDVHHGPHYTLPERTRLPLVATVHDLTFFDHPEWHERTKVVVFRRAIRRAAARADAIVCVSRTTAELFQERMTPRGEVFVVPHGVDHTRFRPGDHDADADEARLRSLGVQPPYVLFLGTMEPRKSVPDLVNAFARVAPGHGGVSLVLAGRPGWGGDVIQRAIDGLGTDMVRRVVRTGYVPDEAVPALLRRAAVVAYPAREEGFGLPALEALACAAPLVTTAGTAMAEVAGDAALLVAPGSVDDLAGALDDTLAGGPGVESRREHGLSIAAGYTWERSADGHVQAYRSVLRGDR